MGYTVLYIAFTAVALWLLSEVLLQEKARLRWRLLAFVGFLFVVYGVVSTQILVIILGAAGFGTGQTLVTISYRRGFTTGWALRVRPGVLRGRKATDDLPAEDEDYADEEYEGAGYADEKYAELGPEAAPPEPAAVPEPDDNTRIYSPTPLPEEAAEPAGTFNAFDGYGGYDTGAGYGTGTGWQDTAQPAASYGYDPYAPAAGDDVFANGAPAYTGYDQTYSAPAYDPYAAAAQTYDPYAQGQYEQQPQPQQDYASSYQQPQYPQDPYQQNPYPTENWSPADPYAQQPDPTQPPQQPTDQYGNYQQYESYQPYGY
jgi:hypothetical protein